MNWTASGRSHVVWNNSNCWREKATDESHRDAAFCLLCTRVCVCVWSVCPNILFEWIVKILFECKSDRHRYAEICPSEVFASKNMGTGEMDSLRMGLAISLRDGVCQPSQRWCKPTISKIVCAPASENRIPRKRKRKLFTFADSDDCHTPLSPAL